MVSKETVVGKSAGVESEWRDEPNCSLFIWLPWEGAAFFSGEDGAGSLGLPRSNMTPEILHNQAG